MRLISAAGLLALCGCGAGPDDSGHCTGNITVTVSHETNPEFAWTPADCQIHELNVTEHQQVQNQFLLHG